MYRRSPSPDFSVASPFLLRSNLKSLGRRIICAIALGERQQIA